MHRDRPRPQRHVRRRPAAGRRAAGDRLDDRLDPNVADARQLGALPNLGARRARDIVAYRDRLRARDPGRVVYRTEEDLLRVDGVGVAMVAQLRPFLRFPTTGPTTRGD